MQPVIRSIGILTGIMVAAGILCWGCSKTEEQEPGARRGTMEYYEQMIRVDPRDAESHFLLGVIYMSHQRDEEAIDTLEQAVFLGLEPEFEMYAYDNLGQTYLALGHYAKANEAFNRVIQIDPTWSWSHYGLGQVYLKPGKKDSARREYEILKDLDKDLAATLFQSINQAS